MTKKNKYKPDDKEQSKLFIKKVREIGADEEGSLAEELLEHLARKPPHPKGKKKA